MEPLDELVKRQQQQYADLLEYQRGVWKNLQNGYNNNIPLDVVQAFNKAGTQDLNNLAKTQILERENNPEYAKVMEADRNIKLAEQSAFYDMDEISKSKKLEEQNEKKIQEQADQKKAQEQYRKMMMNRHLQNGNDLTM